MSLPNATRWSRGVCFGTALGAAALLLVTPAWGAQRAVYGGTTSKDRTTLEPFVVRADARARKVRSIVLSWEAPCTDGETLPYSGDLPVSTGTPGFGDPGDALVPTANARGRFAGRAVHNGSLSDGSTVETQTRVTGRLAKGTARGAMTATA